MSELDPSQNPVRVLLAEDHEMVRQGLRSLLRNLPWLEVVGEAADGRAAAELAEALGPDVVVMDVSMPVLNGIEATRRITARDGNGTRVLALSAHGDPNLAASMFEAGAAGYVGKGCGLDELAEALRSVAAGGRYVSPPVAASLTRDRAAGGRAGSGASDGLSGREREVLQLLAEGKSVKQIALALGISTKTVETHRSHVKEKLGIDSVAGLTKYALREGLTPP